MAREFSSLPLIVHNVPVRTAVDIAPETIARLARGHDNIVGVKETTKDFEHVYHVLSLCGTDFLAYSGIELLCYPMPALGGAGHLSCVANFAWRPVAALYDTFAAGDQEDARRLHYALHPLVEPAFLETNPVSAKWAMEHLGLLAQLSEGAREKVLDLLAASEHLPERVGDRG